MTEHVAVSFAGGHPKDTLHPSAQVHRYEQFLRDMSDFAEMNAAYAEHFSEPYPARTTIAVGGLPLDARVEIEMVARLR